MTRGGGGRGAVFLFIVGVLYVLEVVAAALLLIMPPGDLTLDIIVYMVAMAALTAVAVNQAAERIGECVGRLERRTGYAGREAAENAWLHGFWRRVSRAAAAAREARIPAILLAAGTLGLAYPAALALLHAAYNHAASLLGRSGAPPSPGAIVASFSLLYPVAYTRYRPLP